MNSDERCVLPTKVKQIGSIGDGSKIYMEDYANTYLQQYAASERGREKIAVLVGQSQMVDGEEIIFISGAIQGKHSTHKNGMVELTEKSWQYIDKQMKMYFEGLEVIGWAYIQPGFEDYVNENLLDFQKKSETKGLRVLYLMDPSERVNSFFKWHSGDRVLEILKGYMVYFEKNEGMHEYMLENKLKPVANEEEKPIKDDVVARARELREEPKAIKNKNRAAVEQKRMVNLLGSLSFVMFLVCFIMGAGLIQNDERLNEMENKMLMMEAALDGTQSVFASQNVQEETIESTTLEQTTLQPSTVSTTRKPVEEVSTKPVVAVEETTQEETKPVASAKDYWVYTVQDGDTLLKICGECYGDKSMVEKVMDINGLDNPDKLYIGMELNMP